MPICIFFFLTVADADPTLQASFFTSVIVKIDVTMVFLFRCYSSYQACELFLMLTLISDNLISDTLTNIKAGLCGVTEEEYGGADGAEVGNIEWT